MTHVNQGTEYPYYMVEGRWFPAEDYEWAVCFAHMMATRMGRPVALLRELDRMTPAAVIYTAEPEPELSSGQ